MDRRTFLKGTAAALAIPAFPPGLQAASIRRSRSAPLFDAFEGSTICRVVALGGAGTRIVTGQIRQLFDADRIIAIDTNAFALSEAIADDKILLSPHADSIFTKGNPAVASALAWQAREQISSALTGAHLVFIVAGMGGGTGSGAGPVVARIAKGVIGEGAYVVAVVTTPYASEKLPRYLVAESGMRELQRSADVLVEIRNGKLYDRWYRKDQDNWLPDFFSYTSRAFGETYATLAGSILRPGLVGIDFEDVRTVLSCGASASVGWANAERGSWGDDTARLVTQAACRHPLLGEDRLRNALGVQVSIAMNSSIQSLRHYKEVMQEVRRVTSDAAHLIASTEIIDTSPEGLAVRIVAVE